MARNRNGLPISGWIVLDKPLGLSSAQALSKVQRLLNAKKAGHGGTLDPLATGVLALAFGKATKTTAYVMDGLKEYRFTVTFGQATSTEDGEGEVIETSSVRPSTEEVERLLPGFVGDIAQTPPAFSALKVNGQRAYKLAREGLAPEMKSRIVRIEDVRLVSRPDPDHAEFLVRCGKGTYVRSLGRDIAKAAGTCGHISALRRTVCGPFAEANAFSLEKLEELVHIAPQSMYLLPIETALDGIPALALTEDEARSIRHGRAIPIEEIVAGEGLHTMTSEDTILAKREGRLIALVRVCDGMLRPVRVVQPDAEED